MLAVTTLLLVLSANDRPAVVPSVRAELEVCAARIEELKIRHERGPELDRLLRRAQQLAAELERSAAEDPAPADQAGPPPEELRERADAARDEADRLAGEIAALDVRIQDARRSRGEAGPGFERAVLGTGALPAPADRVRTLIAARAVLSERRQRAEAEAARLDAAARDAEREP
jgi:hypothetical protein